MSTTSISQRMHPHKTGIFSRSKEATAAGAVSVPQTDVRTRRLLPPVRIPWRSADGIRRVERLLTPASFGLPNDTAPCQLTAPGAVVLDFGQELNGGLQILLGGSAPRQPTGLRVRFGESIGEVMGDPDRVLPCHDLVLETPWHGAVEIGQTGFRFVRLDAVAADTPIALSGVRAIAQERADVRQGTFRCNDARINAIWDCSAHTAELCLQELLLAGLKSARRPHIDHLHPAILAIAALHGDHATIRETLDLLRDITPIGTWMDHRPAASLWWLIAIGSWFLRTGNRSWLAGQRPLLLGLVAQLDALVGKDGAIRNTIGITDLSLEGDEALAGTCLVAKALRTAASLCQALDESAAAETARQSEQRLLRRPLPTARTRGGAALAVVAGRRDPVEANRTALSAIPDPHLSACTAAFVMRARSMAADHRGALDLMRRYWGGMLDLGATSCWDQFDAEWSSAPHIDEMPDPGLPHPLRDAGGPAWSLDLCSARATGPASWLVEQVIGLTAIEPGYQAVRIAPGLGDLTWVEASLPTPRGLITIRHERRHDGQLHTISTLPTSVTQVE